MKTFRCQKSDQKHASLSHQSHLRKVNRWARMHCPELMLWLYWRHSSNWMQSLSIYCQPALRVDWMTLLGRSSIVRLLDICILGNRSACKILVKCDWILNCWERLGRITSSGWFRRFKFQPKNELLFTDMGCWSTGQCDLSIHWRSEFESHGFSEFLLYNCLNRTKNKRKRSWGWHVLKNLGAVVVLSCLFCCNMFSSHWKKLNEATAAERKYKNDQRKAGPKNFNLAFQVVWQTSCYVKATTWNFMIFIFKLQTNATKSHKTWKCCSSHFAAEKFSPFLLIPKQMSDKKSALMSCSCFSSRDQYSKTFSHAKE